MIRPWNVSLKASSTQLLLLVSEQGANDLLKARLPMDPQHPRALLTLLEGLALWSAHPLTVAVTAGESSERLYGSGLFGDELWPGESQLVQFRLVSPERQKPLASTLGSFRSLRRTRAVGT
jgi:hypothetical protein